MSDVTAAEDLLYATLSRPEEWRMTLLAADINRYLVGERRDIFELSTPEDLSTVYTRDRREVYTLELLLDVDDFIDSALVSHGEDMLHLVPLPEKDDLATLLEALTALLPQEATP